MRSSVRHLYPAAVVAFFAIMAGWLARDYLIPAWRTEDGTRVSSAILADAFTNTDDWLVVDVGNQRVGWLRSIAERLEDGRYASYMNFKADPMLGGAFLQVAATASPTLELRSFQAIAHNPRSDEPFLEMRGAVERSTLVVEIRTPTGVRREEVRLPRPPMLGASIDPLLSSPEMVAGEAYIFDIADPLLGAEGSRLRLVWTGRELVRTPDGPADARRIDATMGPVKMVVHVDPVGRQARREIGLLDPSGVRRGMDSPPFRDGFPTVVLSLRTQIEIEPHAPDLLEVLDPPEFAADQLRGPSEGDILGGLSIFPALIQGNLGNIPIPGLGRSNGRDG